MVILHQFDDIDIVNDVRPVRIALQPPKDNTMLNLRRTVQRISLIAALSVSLSACINFPYRAPVQQGNVIEASHAQLIRAGMSKQQVAETAGSPVMVNLFHQDRWDYIYRLDERNKAIQQKRVTIWFSNGVAVKVEHSDLASK